MEWLLKDCGPMWERTISNGSDLGRVKLLLVPDGCFVSLPACIYISRSLGTCIYTESMGMPWESSARQEPWIGRPKISAIVQDCPLETSDG